jgi:hypothetical protein
VVHRPGQGERKQGILRRVVQHVLGRTLIVGHEGRVHPAHRRGNAKEGAPRADGFAQADQHCSHFAGAPTQS